MAHSLMLKSVYAEHDGKPLPIIVDLGYLLRNGKLDGEIDPDVDARFRALCGAGVSRKRFRIEAYHRLLVEFPATKLDAILETFPIVSGETYWRSTHHWRGLAHGAPATKTPA